MVIGVLNETTKNNETRVALTPQVVEKLAKLGNITVFIEKDAGLKAGYDDELYKKAGSQIVAAEKIIENADCIVLVNKLENASPIKKGCIVIGQLDPYRETAEIRALAKSGAIGISMDMIPRSTIAQKMDVLSSQASLAGYQAVIEAGHILNKIFPMMTTPSGTITPTKIFIIGAGVAGLQAIATAKRLGASVSAFDTRPVVEEQVKSLGAKFVKIDLGETGQTKDGYASALTDEQLKLQQEKMAKTCIQSDVIITTAKLFGRNAPRIISDDIIKQMNKGSLIIDMAVDTGGNVEGSQPNKVVERHGVLVYGYGRPELDVSFHASQMYANNVYAFLEMFWDKEKSMLNLTQEHEILANTIITQNGEIVHQKIKELQ